METCYRKKEKHAFDLFLLLNVPNTDRKDHDAKDDTPEEEKMPQLEDMLKGRDDMRAHCYFAYYFLPIVVGKNHWKKLIWQRVSLNSLATASDEAFALLMLENNKEKWDFMHGKTKEELKEARKAKTIPDV